LFRNVFENYFNDKAIGKVPGGIPEGALAIQAVCNDLPKFFAQGVEQAGERPLDYKCYGSCGQTNFSFSKVPWVACCRTNITRSVQRSYFIVLLFKEDMTGCYLTLNQGFTQYRNIFPTADLSRQYAMVGARLINQLVDTPHNFEVGPIDLATTSGLGKGYEAGSVLSRYYDRNNPRIEGDVLNDFGQLLEIYDRLAKVVPADVTDLLTGDEAAYQAATNMLANEPDEGEQDERPAALPQRNPAGQGGGWRRDAAQAARALRNAGHRCEIDPEHDTFISEATRLNYVEAHHLVPMAHQGDFQHSLDVPENIISLCPTCHRKIHFGPVAERSEMSARLLTERTEGLQRRGVEVTERRLRAIYRRETVQD